MSAPDMPRSISRIPEGSGSAHRRWRHGEAHPWGQSPVPAEHQIRGLGPITISVPDLRRTERVLTGVLGMRQVREHPTQSGTAMCTSSRWAPAARRRNCMSPSSRICPSRARRRRACIMLLSGRRTRAPACLEGAAGRLRAPEQRRGGAVLFPLALLPRAERHPVRDRHRRSRLCRRRADRDSR